MEFRELRAQVFQLFDKNQFSDIIPLVEREAGNFPEQGRLTSYWLFAMYARVARTDDALRTFREALNRGWWFTENELRGDEMKHLRGNPAFEEMIAQSVALETEAQKLIEPHQIVHQPATNPSTAPLLMALHGNNTTAATGEWFWKPLVESEGLTLSLGQSTRPGNHANTFFWDDYETSKRDVEHYYAELKNQYALNPSQVVLGGFSGGAQVAIRLALEGAFGAKGFVTVAAWMGHDPDLTDLREVIQMETAKKLRGVLIIGDEDVSSYKGAVKLAELLSAAGISHQLNVVRGLSHTYPQNFAESLRNAVRFVLDQ